MFVSQLIKRISVINEIVYSESFEIQLIGEKNLQDLLKMNNAKKFEFQYTCPGEKTLKYLLKIE